MGTITEDDDDERPASTTEEVVETTEEPKEPSEPEIEVVEAGGEDERPNASTEDEDDGDGEPRRRPKETAAERRERAKQAKIRDKRELEFQKREMERMARELGDLRRNQVASVANDLDVRYASAMAEVDQFDRIKAAAISKNAGADAVAADNLRTAAIQKANQAAEAKQALLAQVNQPVAKPLPYEGMARDFMAANSWYNHGANDADSRLVAEIDSEVAKDYVPTSPAYWAELQRRVRINLPQHFTADDGGDEPAPRQNKNTRRGPPTGGSTRGNSSTTNATQVLLSPGRVAALKDAGLWDNLKDRQRMAKKYAQFDKDQQG